MREAPVETHPYVTLLGLAHGALLPQAAAPEGVAEQRVTEPQPDDGVPADELFERLAPSAWHAQTTREFEQQGTVSPRPQRVAFVRALCAEPARIATAESLAHECAARLAPYGASLNPRFRWSYFSRAVFERGALPGYAPDDPINVAAQTLVSNREPRVLAAERAVERHTRSAQLVLLASWCIRWELRIDLTTAAPNPFHPMLALVGQGCWLRGFTRDGAARIALLSA